VTPRREYSAAHVAGKMIGVMTRLLLVVVVASACAPTRWLVGLPPEKPQPRHEPTPPTSLAMVADVGAGAAGDLGRESLMGGPAAYPGFEASAGIGGRRGTSAVLFRVRLDVSPGMASSPSVRTGAAGVSYLSWEQIPLVNIPMEFEAGAGVGAFDRTADPGIYLGLDVFGGIGVPVRSERDLLIAIRMSNIHSQSNALSLFYPPFGNQQVFTFALALSWRPK
jgi:hypothetical protein